MSIATVSSKGQITLPAEAREILGIRPGARVSVRVVHQAIVIEQMTDFLSLKGALGPALPPEEETGAMAAEAARAQVRR